jgi:hypothetical protein
VARIHGWRGIGVDGKQHYQALSDVTEFDQAKTAAGKWLKTVSGGATTTISRGTIREALTAYVASVADSGRETKPIKQQLVHALRKDLKFAALPLERLTKEQFKHWRDSIKPGRLPRTVNRYSRQVQAGLTHAVRVRSATRQTQAGNEEGRRDGSLPVHQALHGSLCLLQRAVQG